MLPCAAKTEILDALDRLAQPNPLSFRLPQMPRPEGALGDHANTLLGNQDLLVEVLGYVFLTADAEPEAKVNQNLFSVTCKRALIYLFCSVKCRACAQVTISSRPLLQETFGKYAEDIPSAHSRHVSPRNLPRCSPALASSLSSTDAEWKSSMHVHRCNAVKLDTRTPVCPSFIFLSIF